MEGAPDSARLCEEDSLLCSEQLTQNPPGGGEKGRGRLFLPSDKLRAWNQRALELEGARDSPSQGGKLSPGRS